jgi:sugar phosphate permease
MEVFTRRWYQSRFTSAAEIQHIRSESNTFVSNRYGKEEQVTARQGKRRNFDLHWLDRIIRARSIRPLSTATETFKSPHIWGLAVAYLLMTGIINVILAWLPTYLTTVKHLSILNVGFIASAPFIGGVLGNLLGGLISDRILGKRRKPTIIITALSSIFMMYSLVNAPNDPIALLIMLFFTGLLLNLGYSSFTVYPAGLTTKEAYPLAVSVVNTGGQAGGAALPFITGLILDAYSWDAVFLFLAASSLIALAVITFVVEPIKDEKEDHVDAVP